MTTNLTAPPLSPKPGSQPGHVQGSCIPLNGARSPINGRINGHLVFELEPAFQFAPADICRQWQRRGWSMVALETGVALHGLNTMIDTLNAVVAADCPFCEVRWTAEDDFETVSVCGLHKEERIW